MLAPVVLVGLHDADAGEARVVERAVVAAAPEAVQPVDQHRLEVRNVKVRHPGHVAGQLAGHAIDLAAHAAPRPPRLLGLGDRRRLGEHPVDIVADHAVDALDVSDHVVVQHRFDVPALAHRHRRHVAPAEEALLLAGEAGEDERGGEGTRVPAQHPRGLHRARHAARVVIGARRIVGEVVVVRDPAVDVSRHDHVAVRIGRPPQDGEHVDHLGVRRYPASLPSGDHVALERDLEAAAAGVGDDLEPGVNPAPRRADAPGLARGLGHRMPRPEADEGPDIGLDPVGGDRLHQLVHPRIAPGRLPVLGCPRRRGQGKQESEGPSPATQQFGHGAALYHAAPGPLTERGPVRPAAPEAPRPEPGHPPPDRHRPRPDLLRGRGRGSRSPRRGRARRRPVMSWRR